MERQLSNGSLLPKMSRPFDHGITAMLLIIFGTFGLAVGGTMTGLAYGYEKGEQFTTVVITYSIAYIYTKLFFLIKKFSFASASSHYSTNSRSIITSDVILWAPFFLQLVELEFLWHYL